MKDGEIGRCQIGYYADNRVVGGSVVPKRSTLRYTLSFIWVVSAHVDSSRCRCIPWITPLREAITPFLLVSGLGKENIFWLSHFGATICGKGL